MLAIGCKRRRAGIVGAGVAPLPIVDVVGGSSHGGRVFVEVAKAEIALVAEERAQLAGLVIMINAKGFLFRLQADDANAALFSKPRGVLLH